MHKIFKFKGLDEKVYALTDKEKKFVEHYLLSKGSGVDAIFEAGYKPKNAKIAAQMAYENLTKPHICAYVNLKLEEYGFTDNNVERQHLFVLNQYSNLAAKNQAIDMFYKKRGSYALEKKQMEEIDKWAKLTNEELAAIAGGSKGSVRTPAK